MTDLNEKRQSLHLLKKVAQKYYTIISNALSVGATERAQEELDKMLKDFDSAFLGLHKKRRKGE